MNIGVQISLSAQVSAQVVTTLCDPMASLSITNSWSLLKLMSIGLMMPSNHLILCRPLLLLPPIPPSIRVFSNESSLHIRWPKYWSFSFNISPSNEHPGLISFRMDWSDLLAVQGTLKSLLQQHSSRASTGLIHHEFYQWEILSHLHWARLQRLSCWKEESGESEVATSWKMPFNEHLSDASQTVQTMCACLVWITAPGG